MAKFQMNVTLDTTPRFTARAADGASTSTPLAEADVGKFVKLVGDSCFGLAAVGDEIQGVLGEVLAATQDGYAIGGFSNSGRIKVVLDGLQGTPGTGTVVVGDFVVAGTAVARGTSLNYGPPKVCKATAASAGLTYTWRVVALLSGSGGVGSVAVIEKV